MSSGAGAAALACIDFLVELGARPENIFITDVEGVVYKGRASMNERMAIYARDTNARRLDDVIGGADVFVGLSAGGVLTPEMAKKMGARPLIMALANPTPEIEPEAALLARPDAMICTGRSDYPNQVNNVLCFPYIFRGALDVAASTINEAMKLAAVRAIAELAHEPPSDVVARAYGGKTRQFGADSLIPSPFDPRLILRIAPAVAKAAMASGVAKKPIADFAAYQETLSRFVFRSGFIMKPLMQAAKADPRRVIYAEGEDERVLRAVQTIVEEGIARPILIGRPEVIDARLERFGLSVRPERDFALVNPQDDPRYRDYVATYLDVAGRRGVTPDAARTLVRTNSTVIAALAVKRGDADAMLCGLDGRFDSRLRLHPRHHRPRARRHRFRRDEPHDHHQGRLLHHRHPCEARSAGFRDRGDGADVRAPCPPLRPRAAHRPRLAFGFRHRTMRPRRSRCAGRWKFCAPARRTSKSTARCRRTPRCRRRSATACCRPLASRARPMFSSCRISDAANIAYTMTMIMADALPVGPILIGGARPAHILTPSTTARGIVNMTAVAVAEAQSESRLAAAEKAEL